MGERRRTIEIMFAFRRTSRSVVTLLLLVALVSSVLSTPAACASGGREADTTCRAARCCCAAPVGPPACCCERHDRAPSQTPPLPVKDSGGPEWAVTLAATPPHFFAEL